MELRWNTDRRRDDRVRFCMEICRGIFILEALDEEYEIEEVTDISLAGMGFELSSYLDPETPVNIVYEDHDHRIVVSSTVIWCEDQGAIHANYQFGIVFDYSSEDASSRLLQVLGDCFEPRDLSF